MIEIVLVLLIAAVAALAIVGYQRLQTVREELEELARLRDEEAQLRTSLAQMATELQQAAEALGDALTARTEALRAVLEEADRQAARLLEATADSAPHAVLPAHAASDQPDESEVEPLAARAAVALAGYAVGHQPPPLGDGLTTALGTPSITQHSSVDDVFRLAEAGLDVTEIAKRTRRGREEVRLLLAVSRHRMTEGRVA